MPDIVRDTLKDLGPCVSTALVAELVKRYSLAPAAARQRVSRSTSIRKLAHLKFPRNARFVYLQQDYGAPDFWHALTEALLEHTIAYGGGLAALLARGGAMPVAHFEIACGAPLAQKGHLSPSTVLSRLQAAGLVKTFAVPDIGTCVELAQQSAAASYELAEMRARLRTEQILLSAIKEWARNLGLVSYNTVALRDESDKQPKVGTFNWDLAAPSYLAPLSQWQNGKPKPGFLVCDVLLGVNVSAIELQPFINKCKTLRSLHNIGRCLQFFVAEGYEPDALKLAKAEGIVPATTSTLFGHEVAKALRELSDILRDIYPQEGILEKVEEIFDRLGHIEGASNNLRGALFEYLVAEAVRSTSVQNSIQLKQIFRDDESGRVAEVDVLVCRDNHSIRFIECKGYKPGGTIPDDMVQGWLEDRLPVIWKVAKKQRPWRNCSYQFEFWTTGDISEAARKRIDDASSKVHQYSIKAISRDELMPLVKESKNAALNATLREHFFDHPMEKAERAAVRKRQRLLKPPQSKLTKRGGADEFAFEPVEVSLLFGEVE